MGGAELEMPQEIGALNLWRIELLAGKRRVMDFDSLWRAACHEARAREEIRQGLKTAAAHDRIEAARIILAAMPEGSE
jgi:hypothetical protein